MCRRNEKFTDTNKPILNTYYCFTPDIENDKRWVYTTNGGVLNGVGGGIYKLGVMQNNDLQKSNIWKRNHKC
jgi:hypothetical protein